MNEQNPQSSAPPKPTGIKRIGLAFIYSFDGFRAAWRGEAAFRQEVALAAVLLPCSIFLGQNAIEYSVLVGSVLLVLIVELLNSAIEATVDRIGMDRHPLAKNAKDMGSAAVLVSLTIVVLVWGAIAYARFGS